MGGVEFKLAVADELRRAEDRVHQVAGVVENGVMAHCRQGKRVEGVAVGLTAPRGALGEKIVGLKSYEAAVGVQWIEGEWEVHLIEMVGKGREWSQVVELGMQELVKIHCEKMCQDGCGMLD